MKEFASFKTVTKDDNFWCALCTEQIEEGTFQIKGKILKIDICTDCLDYTVEELKQLTNNT